MSIFSKPSVTNLRNDRNNSIPEGLWQKCPSCAEVILKQDWINNLMVCPKCHHHLPISAKKRIASLADPRSFSEIDSSLLAANPLGFVNYGEKASGQRDKTGLNDAIITGTCTIQSFPICLAVMDFAFFAGSMGSVVGEKITRAVERAIQEKRGVIIFAASSGARMQEGALSLMQMAKTSGALAQLAKAGLPFISVMTHPTTGGVTASFATLGDINIAEPQAMIGFAGPRVVKETTHQNLPEGFQTSEFMLAHGLLDAIVDRRDMRAYLGKLLSYLLPSQSH